MLETYIHLLHSLAGCTTIFRDHRNLEALEKLRVTRNQHDKWLQLIQASVTIKPISEELKIRHESHEFIHPEKKAFKRWN
jgi:hypothetical protein